MTDAADRRIKRAHKFVQKVKHSLHMEWGLEYENKPAPYMDGAELRITSINSPIFAVIQSFNGGPEWWWGVYDASYSDIPPEPPREIDTGTGESAMECVTQALTALFRADAELITRGVFD